MEVGAMTKHYISTLPLSFSEIEALFEEVLSAGRFQGEAIRQKANKILCDGQFPPSNVYIDENNNYCVDIACAGYEESDISVTYEERYLIVNLKNPKTANAVKTWVQRGIKIADSESRYYVSEKYDESKIKATFQRGILRLSLPLKPEKSPIKVKVG